MAEATGLALLPGCECAVWAGGRMGTECGVVPTTGREGEGEKEEEENLQAFTPRCLVVRLNDRGDGTGSSPRTVSVLSS